jgi:UDP-glucose-4-epimerase GalE
MPEITPTILVTGGAGYVGSHCCKALAAAGYLPVVYDNFSTGHPEFVKWGPVIEGDIRDLPTLAGAIERYQPIAVMHFAALALVGPSMTRPGAYWDVNVGGTLALLDAMTYWDVDKIVFSSSCAVYGEPPDSPIVEDSAKVPVNPYGATKLTAERMLDDYDRAHGVKSVRLRYFNAAGADPDGEIGEDHDPETHLIPLVLDAALGRREGIAILGADYPTEDGTAVRDYVHVVDLATAHVNALQYLLEGGATTAINLGTGLGASVAAVVSAAERVVGHPIAWDVAPRRAGDPARLVADPGKAARVLGWRAGRSNLNAMLADAWSWHRSRFGGSHRVGSGPFDVAEQLVAAE